MRVRVRVRGEDDGEGQAVSKWGATESQGQGRTAAQGECDDVSVVRPTH